MTSLPDAGRGETATATVVLSVELVEALAEQVTERVLRRLEARPQSQTESPYMTIEEAATFLRCRRQRVDDLLSRRRLTRHKEGARTLLLRAEVQAHVQDEGAGRRRRATAHRTSLSVYERREEL